MKRVRNRLIDITPGTPPMATARQIAANQANSLRSTGPRSPQGKIASRANSLKHGLSGRGVVLPHEEIDAIAERFDRWGASMLPRDDHEAWVVETIAVESVRVDRCRLHEVAYRERVADRAEDFWDIDRRLAAAELAAQLPRKPELVAWQLRKTLQGVDLLIGRWEVLGKTLAMTGTWDESQRATALDLLGVPRDQRQGWTVLVPDPADGPGEAEWFARMVKRELGDLEALRPGLEGHDAVERLRAMAGDASPSDAELKRLRRYEKGCLRTLQWALAQLKAWQKVALPSPSADDPASDGHPAGPATPSGHEDHRSENSDPTPPAAVAEDDGPDPEPSPQPKAPATHVLSKPVPLASALLSTVPGNRRARRAARSRARRG
jgi:hypothetical protein